MEFPTDSVRFARHQLRGCLHGMKLCVAALECELPPDEAREFLDHIESAATALPGLLDSLEAVASPRPEA